jgi:hypothetical protein
LTFIIDAKPEFFAALSQKMCPDYFHIHHREMRRLPFISVYVEKKLWKNQFDAAVEFYALRNAVLRRPLAFMRVSL